MQHDYTQAAAYISALTGDVNTVVDFRMIHDVKKDIPALTMRDTLANSWNWITALNLQGYGAFVAIQALDGNGRHLENVAFIRTHVVDLDDLATVQQSYQAACNWQPLPSFGVNSSPGKYHVYWPAVPYQDNARYQLIQRKLVAVFGGDPKVIDAARVMRLPGTYHLKNPTNPHLVTCHSLQGYGYATAPEHLEYALQDVHVSMGGSGGRRELGDPELAAPSETWAKAALMHVDPNNLDRGEWITVTSAFKQSIWSLTNQDDAYIFWCNWCAQYEHNDTGENSKQWNSIRNTEVGWKNLINRAPNVQAMIKLGNPTTFNPPIPTQTPPAAPPSGTFTPYAPPTLAPLTTPAAYGGEPLQTVQPMPDPASAITSEMLTPQECSMYFNDCTFVERFGEILTPGGRMLGPGAFNGKFGGKKFIIDSTGSVTDEAWKAATRSTAWRIPNVDHIRFVPERKPGEHIIDALGRYGVNTYKPAIITRKKGDPSPFLNHLNLIIPDFNDRKQFVEYLVHNAKYPGTKIPWAYLIQSEEGAGKGVIKSVIKHVMGGPYVHFPNAKELIESGSKFNAWMRAKLFIVVDEIKVDERRDMIEVLKPMISEAEIEIQGKGADQDKEDNYSNWIFFSNYKDAIPIRKNGRRFAIIYSAIQSVDDLRLRGMDQTYFDRLYNWLEFGGGKEIVAEYLITYPLERGSIPMRAPETSSTKEALHQSRGPIETLILECAEDMQAGFKNGWASTIAIDKEMKARGMKHVAGSTISRILESMGYQHIGRSRRAYFKEDVTQRTTLYNLDRNANPDLFGTAQGYEG